MAAFPDRFLTATSDDAPETASENRFRNVDAPYVSGEGDGDTRRAEWSLRYRTDRFDSNQRTSGTGWRCMVIPIDLP